ncbi:SGNH/GDSL hydrolase family protein [uncultured Alistipes sp.]|uniref:SGNH/GDSL hydrolase family protein n=1 Tax=uncultured Alistipes sp. TaxID=538949 RepID=UPI002601F3A2|nr:SGNH/GDSL hydrolase family protein [uncultured Alistipes sp.]
MKRFIILCAALLAAVTSEAQMRFVDATELTLLGKALPTTHPYHRIDTARYKGFTRSENQQVRCTAGLALVFRTNTTRLDLHPEYAPYVHKGANSPRIATEGFDLYIRRDGEWVYASSLAPKKRGESYTLIEHMDTSEKECLLYLPNYSELLSLKVGVDEGADLAPMENPFRHKIVIFGSSFTHGISTSRAGMSYPMQIERNTGLYFCSIACSGNCKLQPYFADYLADVKDADAMVFDAFSNPSAAMIEERLIPFIERIRASLPATPLIFVQTIYREGGNFNLEVRRKEEAKREMARRMMKRAMKRFEGVYFLDIPDLTGDDHVTSADGTHPSDLGYWRWAQRLQPELLRVLGECGIR